MRALLLMFVMLTFGVTNSQTTDGLYFNFNCGYELRLERKAAIENLGNTEVFALFTTQPGNENNQDSSITTIINKGNIADVVVTPSYIEDWDEFVFQAHLIIITSKINGFIAANAAAAKAAAAKANEDAFDAAFDSNTATSTLDREIELENLSRDGVFVEITYPSWGGFKEEYKDADGITFLDADGDEQEIRYHNSDLEDLSDADYTLWYNTTVTKVKDLVQRLINN